MPEEADFLIKDRIIRVRSHGATDISDWQGSLQRVNKISVTEGVNSVLVDTREQSTSPSVRDIYEFTVNLPNNLRFAIVLPDAFQRKNADEMEKVFEVQEAQASVRDVGNSQEKLIQIFEHYEDAITWLKENA